MTDYILYTLLLLGILSAIAALLSVPMTRFFLKRSWKNWLKISIAAFVQAVCLMIILVFQLQKFPGYFDKSISLYKFKSDLRSHFGSHEKENSEFNRQFISDRFVLINTSNALRLEADPMLDSDIGKMVITDREKLADCLNSLSQIPDEIGLVVCDLTFEMESPHDSILSEAIKKLAGEQKIMLAKGLNENTPLLQFNPNIMVNATAGTQRDKLVTYDLIPQNEPAIAYAMYTKKHNLHWSPAFGPFFHEYQENNPSPTLKYRTITPEMPFIDEFELYSDATSEGLSSSLLVQHLGSFTGSEVNREELLHVISTKNKPIVYIGEFPDYNTHRHAYDVHETVYGPLYGSTIILNIYFNLVNNGHQLKVWELILSTLTIWAYIIYLIWLAKAHTYKNEQRAVRQDVRTIQPSKAKKNKPDKSLTPWLYYVLEGLKKWPHALFIFIVLGLDLTFEHTLNVVILIPYLLVFETLLAKSVKSRSSEKVTQP